MVEGYHIKKMLKVVSKSLCFKKSIDLFWFQPSLSIKIQINLIIIEKNLNRNFPSFFQKLTSGLKTTRPLNCGSTDYSKLQFIDDESKLVLTVGKKVFKLLDQAVFLDPTSEWVSLHK